MGEHLSALALDALAAELPVDLPTSSHVATCAVCRTRLEALKAERAALMQGPAVHALFEKLALPMAQKKTLPRWAPVLFALAAGLWVLVGTRFLPKHNQTLLKGQPTVELLSGNTSVSSAHVGDKLWLAVGGAGHSAVGVFTVDDQAEVSQLLASTKIGSGARVPVGKGFEVTAGSLAVIACFGEHPLAMDVLRAELSSRVARAGKTPLEVLAPDGCVKAKLEVAL